MVVHLLSVPCEAAEPTTSQETPRGHTALPGLRIVEGRMECLQVLQNGVFVEPDSGTIVTDATQPLL